jgi:hypothetical protein
LQTAVLRYRSTAVWEDTATFLLRTDEDSSPSRAHDHWLNDWLTKLCDRYSDGFIHLIYDHSGQQFFLLFTISSGFWITMMWIEKDIRTKNKYYSDGEAGKSQYGNLGPSRYILTELYENRQSCFIQNWYSEYHCACFTSSQIDV